VSKNYQSYIIGIILLIFPSVTSFFNIYSQQNGRENMLVSSIQSGALDTVCFLIDTVHINEVVKPTGYTPLVLALTANQTKIIKYLLNNKANPNIRCKGKTPLMFACEANNKRQIKLLLSKGSKVNETDSAGNTALIYAVQKQPHSVARLLLKHGALLNARNNAGFTARDMAHLSGNKPMLNYLRTMFENHLPNYFDGPYVFYRGKNKIEMFYFKYDSLKRRTYKYSCLSALNNTKGVIKNIAGDTLTDVVKTSFESGASFISGVEKMFVFGDIHGQCDSLKKFLINNHITDQFLNWTFGSGHLVFLGDIFDRGEQVTDVLWLIYKLENEAVQFGGKVHLILGNHEIMVLSGDLRYLTDKYYYLFKNLYFNYQNFYGNKTLLGRWLRSKNVILKINDNLFVHGGINPKLQQYNLSVDSINYKVRTYLNNKSKNKRKDPVMNFLIGADGPFWYRGMIPDDNGGPLSEEEVNRVFLYYNVNRIFVGHTIQSQITSYYSGKVYGLDVPFYLFAGKPMEAIYIESNNYFRVFSGGKKEKIK
jgi:hypothetical protein